MRGSEQARADPAQLRAESSGDGAPVVHLSPRLRGLGPSATLAIHERSAALLAAGREVFRLGFGQSPFPVPAPVVEALRAHAGEKAYLPVRGLAALRAAVADHLRRTAGVARDAEDVLIGPGSKELMFLLQLAYDAELILPLPAWVSYAPQARLLGKAVHAAATRAEDGWRLDPERLDTACRALGDGPRILLLNSPGNPTGTRYGARALAALAAVARRHRLLVLSDEIYGELCHRGDHRSIASWYPEGTAITGGLSKWCGAGGWRLGTLVLPAALRWLRDAVAVAASETYTTASAPIQYAAVDAFRGGDAIDRYLRDSRRLLAALGAWTAARLETAGVAVAAPEGGFYLLPTFERHTAALAARSIATAGELCSRLLDDTGVALLPGDAFGLPPATLAARLAYVDFDGAAALEALAALDQDAHLDEAFLRRCCGRTLTAVDRLCDWLPPAG